MAVPGRTTQLEAVNTMLSVIGETPTTDSIISANSSADVVMAVQILDEVTKEVEAQGWHFNTEYDVELTPAGDKHIVLDTNVARIDLEPENTNGLDVIMKYTGGEWRLYDKKDKTYEFDNKVKATIVYYLDFIALPQPAQRYITIRAARIFQDRMVGSGNHHTFNTKDEFRALADLKEWEGDTADHSIFDHYDTLRTVNRGNVVR